MKIVQLITALQLGGAEKVAIDISSNLDNDIFQSIIITILKDDSQFSSSLKKQLNDKGVFWKEFGFKKDFRVLKYIGMFISILQIFIFLLRYKPDIIHSHTDLPDFVLSNILRLYKISGIKHPKIVRTIHNTHLWPSHKKIACYTEKMFLDDDVVYISNGAKSAYEELRNKCDFSHSTKIYFISNGVNLTKYVNKCFDNVLIDHGIRLNENKINLLFVGRLVEQKGFDLLLEALSHLEPSRLEKLRIYAFGEGNLKDMLLKTEYSTLPLEIFQPTNQIASLYACFDYLIMPSRFEGLPLVALEASASMLPVIASNAPGLNEAIPPEWPLVFENENVESLSLLLEKVANSEYEKEALGKQSSEFVKNNFNLMKTVSLYSSIYKNEWENI